MKFGLILPNYGPAASRLTILDTALAAEKLGFASVWVTDHLALPEREAGPYGHIFEALMTLSYLAAATTRLRLGISTMVLPQRNPVEVGKQIATLDALSGGRILFSAGIGWSRGEYRHLNQNYDTRVQRMEDALKVLRTLWRGGSVVSYQGSHFAFERMMFSPEPVQPGGPPLWVAGNSAAALKRAVYFGDGWHPVRLTPDEIRQRLDGIRPLIARRPFTVCVRQVVKFSPSVLDDVYLSGSPEEILARLRAYAESGAEYLLLDFGGETKNDILRAMQTFAEKVLPAV